MPRSAFACSIVPIAALVASLAAIGCGSPDSGTSNTLIFGRGGDSIGLDPAHEEDGESFKVAELIFDTLIQYRQDSTEIEPGVAKSWSSSSDGLTWWFQLREDVRFHDGTQLDALAVATSLSRQFNKAHPLHDIGGPYLYWVALGLSDIISSVFASDPYVVEITLKRAYAPLLSALATPPFSIVSPTALAKLGDDFKFRPVGSGPFRFVEWRPDDRIVLERFDDYWGGTPWIERIVFRAIPDNAARLLEIEQGRIHILEYPDPENLDQIRSMKGVRLIEQPGMNVGYLALNMDHKPLDDVQVRYAINHAIDKRAIVEKLYGGLAIVAKNPLPPTVWGYNDAVEDFVHDPDEARRILAERFPDGFPRELTLYALPVPRPYILNGHNVALAVQSYLAKVGITVRIQTYEWGTYLEKVKSGEHDIAMLGWIADYADPDNFLYFNLDRDNTSPPAGNIAFYRSDELHDLLVRAQQSTDRDERSALYMKAQRVIRQDAPWVTLAHAKNVVVVRSNLQGFVLHPTSWRHLWRVRLDGPIP